MAWQYAALAAYQVYSGLQQADAIRQQAELERQAAEMNAKFAELDAFHAEQDGLTNVARYDNTIEQTVATQQSNLAARDVDISFGTAKEFQDETELTGFLNQLDMQQEANDRARGFRNEARALRLGAKLRQNAANANANATATAGLVNAASTGLSGYDKMGGFSKAKG